MATLNPNPDYPSVLVVDDDDVWVETLIALFNHASIQAKGVSEPLDIFSWTTPEKFGRFDIIFLDMRLGKSSTGAPLSAADVLLHIMTYYPTAKVVIFTQKEITPEECVRCIQFGALGFIPKMSNIDHFILVANVYRRLADEGQLYEERIRALWRELEEPKNPAKGRHLEMFTTNLFNSISGFKVIRNNARILSGEVDLVVQNPNDSNHPFWKQLNSYHIVIECKNVAHPAKKEVFNILQRKVEDKGICNVGILVSWSGVSTGFREMQRAQPGSIKIFYLDRNHLHDLIKRPAIRREDYLREVLALQF